jgi:hypothetical protein
VTGSTAPRRKSWDSTGTCRHTGLTFPGFR